MEWLRNSPKVTQLLNDRARIQTQAAWPWGLCLTTAPCSPSADLNPALSAAEWFHILSPKSGGSDQIFPAQADDAGASGCGGSNSSLEEQKSVQWSHQTLRSQGADCIHRIKKKKNASKPQNKLKDVHPFPKTSRWFVNSCHCWNTMGDLLGPLSDTEIFRCSSPLCKMVQRLLITCCKF